MASSGEAFVLNKLAELAVRCDVSPAIANVYLNQYWENDDRDMYYAMSYTDGAARNEKEEEGLAKMLKLLGFENELVLKYDDLIDVEEAVDRALSLAPRARTR